jgi:hypothetical protein
MESKDEILDDSCKKAKVAMVEDQRRTWQIRFLI